MSDVIRFACDSCESTLKVAARHAGKAMKCPKCGGKTRIPSLEGARPSSQPARKPAKKAKPAPVEHELGSFEDPYEDEEPTPRRKRRGEEDSGDSPRLLRIPDFVGFGMAGVYSVLFLLAFFGVFSEPLEKADAGPSPEDGSAAGYPKTKALGTIAVSEGTQALGYDPEKELILHAYGRGINAPLQVEGVSVGSGNRAPLSFAFPQDAQSVAEPMFSEDGKRLLVRVSFDGKGDSLQLWSTDPLKLLNEVTAKPIGRAFFPKVLSADGGHLILAGSGAEANKITILDLMTRQVTTEKTFAEPVVPRVATSDLKHVLVTSPSGRSSYQVWATQTGQVTPVLQGERNVREVMFLDGGNRLLIHATKPGGFSEKVALLDWTTNRTIKEFDVDLAPHFLFSHDGKWCVGVSNHGHAKYYDIATGKELRSAPDFMGRSDILRIVRSSDSSRLLIAREATITVHEILKSGGSSPLSQDGNGSKWTRPEEGLGLEGEKPPRGSTPETKPPVVGKPERPPYMVTGKLIDTYTALGHPDAIAYDPKSDTLLVYTYGSFRNYKVERIATGTGQRQVMKFPFRESSTYSDPLFSHEGQHLGIIETPDEGDSIFHLWSSETQQIVVSFSMPDSPRRLSHDGKRLLCIEDSPTPTKYTLYDLTTKKILATQPSRKLESLVCNDDLSTIVLQSFDRKKPHLLWSTQENRVQPILQNFKHVHGLAFAPDGKTLGIVPGIFDSRREFSLWDATTTQTVRVFEEGPSGGKIDFTWDGKWIVESDSQDAQVLIYDIASGGRVGEISLDGEDLIKRCLIASDRSRLVWPVSAGREIAVFELLIDGKPIRPLRKSD